MKNSKSLCYRHRYPAEAISHAVWLYFRLNFSHRDVEDMLAERGIEVSYESIRLWCMKFGRSYAQRLKRKRNGLGHTLYLDEVFLKINGKQRYLWRAVGQDGDVVDVYLQRRRNADAAKRFFKRILKNNGGEPRKIVTDKLGSYGVAHRELIPNVIHETGQYENNKAELSHQPTRVREKVMRRFKSLSQAQRFLSIHAEIYNLFNLGRHLTPARYYRKFRQAAFAS
jgi:putative transposase